MSPARRTTWSSDHTHEATSPYPLLFRNLVPPTPPGFTPLRLVPDTNIRTQKLNLSNNKACLIMLEVVLKELLD